MGELVFRGVGSLASTVEGYNGLIGDLALANGTLRDLVIGFLEGVAVDIDPTVYTWPAVEMSAQGDYGVLNKVETDVALEPN